MVRKFYILIFFVVHVLLKAQIPVPTTTVFNAPLPNYGINSYTRASQQINLTPGFVYGFVTAGATNLQNLNISTYPSYVNNNYTDPSNNENYFTPNTNLQVATTNWNSSVDDIGAYNLNIPIVCSPGTKGIQPNLSINYNSNGANNWLGLGFNLSGIPMITRVNKTIYFDGAPSGINFNSNDAFSLNGSRLLQKSGTYGQNGATYKLEIEDYSFISSFNNQGNGPQYFVVTNTDGLTMEFGRTPDSKNVAKFSNEVLAWYVNKIYDEFGNYLIFDYTNQNGEILINEINYTGNNNAQINPYNKIKFNYMSRSDKNVFHVGGQHFTSEHILKNIICLDINNELVRQYNFEYKYEFASLLSKITEIDSKGNTINPTFFEWTQSGISPELSNNFFISSVNLFQGSVFSTVAADIDGNGIDELLCLNNINSPEIIIRHPGQIVPYTPIPWLQTPINLIGVFAFDEDYDNKDEVFAFVSVNTQYTLYKFKYVNGTLAISIENNGSIPQNTGITSWNNLNIFNNLSNHINNSSYFYSKADISGDNLNDIILVDQFGLRVTPSNGQSQTALPFTNIIKTSLGDFNGDGKTDLFLVRYTGNIVAPIVEVYEYVNNSNSLNLMFSQTINIGTNPNIINWNLLDPIKVAYANAAKSIDFGDIDGDMKTDLFYVYYVNNTQANLNSLRSNGITYVGDISAIPIPTQLNGQEAVYFIRDINNDGLTDFGISSHNPFTYESRFSFYHSNGDKFIPNQSSFGFFDRYIGEMGDFDGNGTVDYVYQNTGTGHKVTYSMFNQNNKKLIKRVFNLKNETKISYKFLPSARYYQEGIPDFNLGQNTTLLKPRLFVVEELIDNGVFNDYGYKNAIYHITGKGFLGFEKTIVRNRNEVILKGVFTTNEFDLTNDLPTRIQKLTTHISTNNIFNLLPNSQSSIKSTTLNYTQSGSNKYLNSVISSSKNYAMSTFMVSTENYDPNQGGKVGTIIETSYNWNSNNAILSIQKDFQYQPFTNQIYNSTFYKLGQINQTNSSNGNSSQFISTYLYDNSFRLISSNENTIPSTIPLVTNYSQFNAFGVPQSVSISAPDLAQPRTSSVNYDATGRFILQSTNSIGNNVSNIYEPGLGNVIKSTDLYGKETKFNYDGLGRLIKTISATGVTINSNYEWDPYTIPTNGILPARDIYRPKITTEISNGGSNVSYLDHKGNVLRIESSGFNGNTIITETSYDYMNRVLRKTEPYFQGQTTVKSTVFTFDEFYRPSNVFQYRNQSIINSIEYTYNNFSTDNNFIKGFKKTKVPNLGNIGFTYFISENNEAGQQDRTINYANIQSPHVVDYTFNQLSLPTQISTSFPSGQGNGITTVGYDAYGRRIVLNDPTTGVYNFQYNRIGEIILENTPNGDVAYQYDQLGRITSKTGNIYGACSYEYVLNGNGKESIKKITGPNNSLEFNYDDFGRLIEQKQKVLIPPVKEFLSQFTYDQNNRMVNHVYPGGFVTSNEYDPNGILIKIKNNNNTIWQLNNLLTPGLINQYSNSGGTNTQLNYDNNLNISEIITGSIAKQTYSIENTTSNVINRQFENFVSNTNIEEGFRFDDFDRLVQTTYQDINDMPVVKDVFNYNANGNLSYKQDCGNYVYGQQGQPYKLTQITNQVGNISLNTLNINYNNFNKVSKIIETDNAREMNFIYGCDEERVKMDYKVNNATIFTRYYADNFDREETNVGYKEWTYINSPTGLCAINYNNNGTNQLFNVTTDHLGSPLLLTSTGGNIVEQFSFDAWGRRRNPNDWTYNNVPNSQFLIRGYTMHEHLDEFGLINMNGRIYDPVLGRFIQPDKLIQNPSNVQNYNRYSYVMNNPIKYNDPSGYVYVRPPFVMADGGSQNDHGHYRYLAEPVIYLDGIRITSGSAGYNMWLGGGGGGVRTSQVFGGWSGNGVVQRGVTTSMGAFLDADKMNPGSVTNLNPRGAYVQLKYLGDNKVGKSVFINPIDGSVSVNKKDFAAYIQWTEAQGGGGRNYGGDGSGSAWDNTLKVVDAINQFNPLANLMDVVSNAFTGADRFGNKMSQGDAWLKAAGVFPVGKVGSSGITMYGSLTSKFGSGYKSVSVIQGSYMNVQLGQKLNAISPGPWSKIYEAGILNGSKVETHYFYNAATGQYANPFIKMSGWGSSGFK
ncbi:MAG: VCBS repeat-containing protein [Sphingobacteriaceae bacterium]|nr:VCBS repeat-containing protein [Sphingobacteriaceae bacterium]